MMGERTVMQEALFYEFSLERHVPADHLLRSIDRFVDLSAIRRASAPLLQRDRPALDRSRADDPDADRRLLLRHPLRAAAVRGGASEPRLSLVLPARPRRRRARPLDLLEEPAWPLPRQRPAARAVRDDGPALHGGGPGRRRRLRGRCQPDQGRRQQQRSAEGLGRCRLGGDGARRAGRSGSISTRSTMPPGARRARCTPKFISQVRPGRALDRRACKGHAFFAYATNYLIDLDHAVIVDVEATRAIRQAEVGAARTMIERTRGALRPLAGAARRRQRLWLGRDARLAGPRARDRAAHPGLRQVRAQRRHLRARRLHLRPGARSLHLSRRQGAPAVPADPSPSRATASTTRASCATAPASTTATPAP